MRLVSRNTALFLYGFLVVLPTLVLGGLHAWQLHEDQKQRLAALPEEAQDAARRLAEAARARLQARIDAENRRPFYHYRERFFPPGTAGADLVFMPSPLAAGSPPPGILGWFTYDFRVGPDAPVEVLPPPDSGDEEWRAMRPSLERTARRLVRHDWEDGVLRRIARYGPGYRTERVPLALAAVNTSPERDIDCMRAEYPKLAQLERLRIGVHVYDFHLRLFRDDDGTPRLLATRLLVFDADPQLAHMPDCFARLAEGASVIQGVFLDPRWAFGEMPFEISSEVLDPSLEFVHAGSAELEPTPGKQSGKVVVPVPLAETYGLEVYDPADLRIGTVGVLAHTHELQALLRQQWWRFLGMAAMLVLSLSLGIVLLLRSVHRDIEQARRTENFVAAVSHELRTPVTALRLFGEMLRDGWASDPEQEAEYQRRIVEESRRLETLVERVLEKSRLDGDPGASSAASVQDLNACVEQAVRDLVGTGPEQDLALELAPEPLEVRLVPEAVRSIVVNLVENARKYAPVGANGRSNEPILVRTARVGSHAVLEVADRGPGIPRAERERIFEAFYRLGDEATRSARGTGLGLHLVRRHALALGGRVEVRDRPGGGALFRVQFPLA